MDAPDPIQPLRMLQGIDAIQQPAPTPAAGAAAGREFATLLEELERLGVRTEAALPSTPAELGRALRDAEAEFVAAMDLRRRLEEAYRSATRTNE